MIDPQKVLALAPDASSVAAAKKVAAGSWRTLGHDARVLWGEVRGSALYQVKVDLQDLRTDCTCPSRKVPCKHALGLMLRADVPEATPPAWASEWIAKRDEAIARREQKPEKAPDPIAQRKREEEREARVLRGLDAFDRFMEDAIRTGLASLESQPGTFEAQAARLVDAQAGGLASRVRRLDYVVGGDPSWPDRLLDRMGKLALLTEAYRRGVDPPLLDDVRLAIGFSLDQREVALRGERVRDLFVVLAQIETDDERLRSQRSWLRGEKTGRTALILQFAPGMAPFPHALLAGTAMDMEIIYWPSATPSRALIDVTHGEAAPYVAPPGFTSIAGAFDALSEDLAKNPWIDRSLFTLEGVVPVRERDRFHLRDATGDALPIATNAPWLLLAISGGSPISVVGEWNGERLFPLAALDGGVHYALGAGDD